jgi:hypothetical protein
MSLNWNEGLQRIAERLREPDVLVRADLPGQANTPWLTKDDIEQKWCEACQQLLRECSVEELDNIGSAALYTVTSGSPFTGPPTNFIDLISVNIDGLPGVEVSPYIYQALLSAPNAKARVYTYDYNGIFFKGSTGTALFLIEPALSVFQSDVPILPQNKFEESLTLVTRMFAFQDSLPEGIAG